MNYAGVIELHKEENPRRQNGGLQRKKTVQSETNSSLTGRTDFWEAEAHRLRLLERGKPVFVVAATYHPSGAIRSKVFMTATGAQRHATKLMERGHVVRIELATLTPTAVLLGGESS